MYYKNNILICFTSLTNIQKQIKNRAQPLDKSEKYDIIDSVTRRRQTSHLIQRKKVIQKNIKNKK